MCYTCQDSVGTLPGLCVGVLMRTCGEKGRGQWRHAPMGDAHLPLHELHYLFLQLIIIIVNY